MGRFTRRRFLLTATAAAATRSLARRLGLAQAPENDAGDLKLWYTKPASQWVDALPIGNGRLGAMVFGGGAIDPIDPQNPKTDRAPGPVSTDPAKETLQLNEDTLWSGLPVDGNNLNAKNYLPAVRSAVLEQKDYHLADQLCRKMQGLFAEAYQPIGSLHVDCTHPGPVTDYRRELDLASAVATTHYRVEDVEFERAAFSSAPDQAIVLRVSAGKPGQLNATLWMDGPLVKAKQTVGGNRLLLTGKAAKHIAGAGHPGSENPVVLSDVPGEGMYYAALLQVNAEGGPCVRAWRQTCRHRCDGAYGGADRGYRLPRIRTETRYVAGRRGGTRYPATRCCTPTELLRLAAAAHRGLPAPL
jgi:alpha-L-fucosidase 2